MKNKAITIIIVVATVILAAIAIFTAVRLYQLRQESVSPTAPESKPQAAISEQDETEAIPEACDNLVFTITPREPGLTCSGKFAFENDSRNTAGNYYLVTPIGEGSEINPGDTFVYSIAYENTGDADVSGATITDPLPNYLEYVDSHEDCSQNTDGEVTCNVGAVAAGDDNQIAIRVKLSDTASEGDAIANTARITPEEGDPSSCSINLKVAEDVPASPTPSPTATPRVTPGATPTPTPASCNNSCDADNDCASGLDCVSGSCRNPSCTTEIDCTCQTPTPTARVTAATPAPSLPDAGIPTPTLIGIGGGAMLLILSLIILAL